MNPELEAQLSALLDGELSSEAEASLREELARSPQLAARLAELEATDAALRALPVRPVPTSAKAQLRARIASDSQASPPPRRRRRFLAVAAAAAAAAALAWLALPGPAPEGPPVAVQPTPESVPAPPVPELPDLLDPADPELELAAELELEPEDVAVVEVLDWLAALDALGADGGSG